MSEPERKAKDSPDSPRPILIKPDKCIKLRQSLRELRARHEGWTTNWLADKYARGPQYIAKVLRYENNQDLLERMEYDLWRMDRKIVERQELYTITESGCRFYRVWVAGADKYVITPVCQVVNEPFKTE